MSADNLENESWIQDQYPLVLLDCIEGNLPLSHHKLRLEKEFVVMILRIIEGSGGHVNGARYIVNSMTAHALLLRSVHLLNYSANLILHRME